MNYIWQKFDLPLVIENKLIKEFKHREYFSREELFDFYRYFEPDLKEGTFGWRIYDLKHRNIIKSLKRGLYVISHKPRFKPNISPQLLKIAKQIAGKFRDIRYCIWDTTWLNEFAQHQITRPIIFIEIEKGFEESLFYELREITSTEVFINPGEKAIDYYIPESRQPVVIKKLLTRAPLLKRTEKKQKFFTPALEKILVDLYTEERLFYYLQGSELIHIYENVISNYTINFTKFFSYAKRRDREQDIKQFMLKNMFHLVKEIIDD